MKIDKLHSDSFFLSNDKRKEMEKIHSECNIVAIACRDIGLSWSGSTAGDHSNLYFRDFKQPTAQERFNHEWGLINGIPKGWSSYTVEQIKVEILRRANISQSLQDFDKRVRAIREYVYSFKDDVLLKFAELNLEFLPSNILRLYNDLAEYEFGTDISDYVKNNLPITSMSRDIEALSKGTVLPTHVYYEAISESGKSAINDFGRFVKILNRFLTLKDNDTNMLYNKYETLIVQLHPNIYESCKELIRAKQYAEAAEKSFKIVRDRLRELTGYETGSEAFGKGKLQVLGASAENVKHDFNEGVKFLTMAIDKFRNAKSHTSTAKIDDPQLGYEYLSLSSLAMRLLTDTENKNGV